MHSEPHVQSIPHHNSYKVYFRKYSEYFSSIHVQLSNACAFLTTILTYTSNISNSIFPNLSDYLLDWHIPEKNATQKGTISMDQVDYFICHILNLYESS